MRTTPLFSAIVAATSILAGCQSPASRPATSGTPEPATTASEQERAAHQENRRLAMEEVVRVLERQVVDAEIEAQRLQRFAHLGGAMAENYQEALEKLEDLRRQLDDARLQLATIPL